MKNKNSEHQYVIGVDGGGTKTVAALANLKGKILAQSKSGPSSPRNVGIKKAVFNVTKAIKPLLKKRKGKIVSTVIALPAVEEEYREKKKTISKLLKKKIPEIFKGKVKIISDQFEAFRSGTNKGNGAILIAGTGCVAHGWRDREDSKASGWGWLADEGSAFWVGQKVFQAILKDLDQRGPKTILTKLVFQRFGEKNITGFLKKIYSENPTEIIPELSIICDKASQKGDKTAKRIMDGAGKELAPNVIKVIKKLKFQKMKFPLVLVGSMFKSKIVLNKVKKDIERIAPKVEFIRPKKTPVIGAIKLALEQI